MVKIPILRWGQPYESLELDKVVHFVTGETLAQVGQANPGLLAKDMKKAQRARDVLREIPCREPGPNDEEGRGFLSRRYTADG
jgi:hypothetical protein